MGSLQSFFTQQLPYLAPQLLVYVVGVVVSLAFLRRHAVPASLVLSACLLLIVVSLAAPLAQSYIIENRGSDGPGEFSRLLMLIGIVSGLLRAVGIGLLLAAAFIGREGRQTDGW